MFVQVGSFVAEDACVVHAEERLSAGTEELARPVFWGVTASKKVGSAVVRNVAKRRLRALAGNELLNCLNELTENSLARLENVQLSKRTLGNLCQVGCQGSSSQNQLTGVISQETNVLRQDANIIRGLSVVLIATKYTPTVPWDTLVADLRRALKLKYDDNNSVSKK
jgi:RNase P protein component